MQCLQKNKSEFGNKKRFVCPGANVIEKPHTHTRERNRFSCFAMSRRGIIHLPTCGIFSLRAPANGSVYLHSRFLCLLECNRTHTHGGITSARTEQKIPESAPLFCEPHFSFGRKEKEQKWIFPLRRWRRRHKSIPYQNKMIYLPTEYISQGNGTRERNDNVDQGLNVKSGREPRIITESANTRTQSAEKASENEN